MSMKLKDLTYEQLMLDFALNGLEAVCVRAYDLTKPELDGYPVVHAYRDIHHIDRLDAAAVFKQVFDYADDNFGTSKLEVHKSASLDNCLVLRLHNGNPLFQALLYEVFIYIKDYEA